MESKSNSSVQAETSGWRDFAHATYFALFIACVLILAEDFWFMENLDQWSYSLVSGSTTADHCHWILESQNVEYYHPECVGQFLKHSEKKNEAGQAIQSEKAVVVLLPDILYETYLKRDLHDAPEGEMPRFIHILQWLAAAKPKLIALDFDLSRQSTTAKFLRESPIFMMQPWLWIHPKPVASPELRNENLRWMSAQCAAANNNLDFVFPTLLANGRYVTDYYRGGNGFAEAIKSKVFDLEEHNSDLTGSHAGLCSLLKTDVEKHRVRQLLRSMTKNNLWYGLLEESKSERAQSSELEPNRIDFRQTENLLQIDLNCDDSEENGCQNLLKQQLNRTGPAKAGGSKQNPLSLLTQSVSNHILIVGGSYGTGDKYDTPIGSLDGATIHALAALTALNTRENEIMEKAFPLIFDVILGIATAYVFAIIWGYHAQARAEGSYVKSLGFYIIDVLTLLFFLAMAAWLSDFLLQRNMWLNPIAVILGVYYDSLTGRSDTVEALVCTPEQNRVHRLPRDKAGFDLAIYLALIDVYSSVFEKKRVVLSRWWSMNGIVMLLISSLKLAVVIWALKNLITS